jgi:hypothetical protein
MFGSSTAAERRSRSFAERRLGPKDKGGNPLGGELFTVFNIEYMFPLAGGLQGAVFADAGSLHHDVRLPSSDPGGDMRYALGLGLRYKVADRPPAARLRCEPKPKGEGVLRRVSTSVSASRFILARGRP